MMRRCYGCDERPARYLAQLAHDLTPTVALCEQCAAWERAGDNVLAICSVPR